MTHAPTQIGGAFIPYENTMAEIDQAKVSPLSAKERWLGLFEQFGRFVKWIPA
ncbi:MAG: hypothetical protein AVDCRST_MAG93-8702 [uncultured Chloroflexia bacterium]|uniref:Uncharacterized protein n=1 Tax=uncultured Chloroflexia bacterium TaxID=1672391 RepID=A0A6J4N2A8_9CHLR|nr:MAG: hypothetical protein AVDCRST_MAG93-8702 [uncultured Chloroflexia bacterium]